jgi:ssDNA-binding replication factor A large subunit
MTTQKELIIEILRQNPQISQEQIQERLEAEKIRTGGLFGDETLLRLIAAKFGVQIQQNHVYNSGILQTGQLLAGLNNVTVEGRLIAVYPVKSFHGAEKSGKLVTVMLMDSDGILRVVLWDSKVELVERGDLKTGQIVRLMHGYTKQDRNGKVELHMGSKSQIEIKTPPQPPDYPSIEKFVSKIQSLNCNSGNVHLSGAVKAVLGKKVFSRSDDSEGVVLRLVFRDDSGEVTMVVWNEKVAELEVLINDSPRLLLVNARVKEAQNGFLEIHVDSNTCVNVLK